MAEAADGDESIDAAAGVDSQCAGSPITRARKNLAALEALAAAEERGSATAEEIAAVCGTIPYEITCRIGRRVPRMYFRDGNCVKTVSYV